MLFSEIYGSYFRTVAAVLAEAVDGTLTDRRLREIVRERAFAESGLSIPAALARGDWPLLDRDLRTPIRHRPTMPLTTLEKRWMKALLLDPRIALFQPDDAGLEDVEPLFRPGTFVYFDRYSDGDPYGDPAYIEHFRQVRQALAEGRWLKIRYAGGHGRLQTAVCRPYRLEWSAKDDKFRLLAADRRRGRTINLARILSCEAVEPQGEVCPPRTETRELTLLLHDRRNALERALLHFSHLEKETERLEADLYRLRLRYDRGDETELLIRVLSFGPMLEVEGPEAFRDLVRERIRRQMALPAGEEAP